MDNMKKKLLFLLFGTLLASYLPAKTASDPKRPKIGLVLSGGGAKGTAHVGVIKVLEKAGIQVDYIAGTSMGAIIGGLYSIGYTAEQLDSIARGMDWKVQLSDKKKRNEQNFIERNQADKYVISVPIKKGAVKEQAFGGIIKGNNLQNTFSTLTIGYHDSIDFNTLPIPFACVAQNIVDGKEVVMHSGILAQAMRASMAVPGAFSPIRYQGMILLDGGMVNNYPVDVVRDMGADIVIGVDVQNELRTESDLKTATDILGQIINLMGQEKYKKNVDTTDVYIKVNVEGYGASSFSGAAVDTLILRGETAALAKWNEIQALAQKMESITKTNHIADNPDTTRRSPIPTLSHERKIAVRHIVFPDMNKKRQQWIMKRCGLKENSYISIQRIEEALTQLCSNMGYEKVSYTLKKGEDGLYTLTFIPEKKYEAEINLGARFDSEELASIQINLTANFKSKKPSRLSLTGRLGKRYMADLFYTHEVKPQWGLELNAGYRFHYNDINLHNEGNRIYNATFRQHTIETSLSTLWLRNLRFTIGLRSEFLNYSDFLYSPQDQTNNDIELLEHERLISYFGELHINSYDRTYFPTRGLQMQTSYALTTDNFSQYEGKRPFFTLLSSWEAAFSTSDNFTILPSLHARLISGTTIAYSQQNLIGSNCIGRFMPQQLPFAGIYNAEIADNMIAILSAHARYRIANIHYIGLRGSFAMDSHKLSTFWSGKRIYGFDLSYSLDTAFGPVSFSMGYGNRTKSLNTYINLGFYF